ncbi:Rpn family recombination-promoting nuclease/putative transposase [Lachnoanaerobaculum umeaense]|uniref:Transposase n=1 Tax=Lachnoanaerobaculum umeaense TaxID=617123 RepID=A0A385PXL7_9FIRM|nr:Rpn family recombination-promoting nuclease/putative transposase [Lachnoanaerobaculum umeaense]AYA98665.1 transposase [Lachnoanaerobaculum umeaense]
MQGKDITQKVLEKYNDVFADILNVLLFDGRNVVDESTLTDALPMSMLKIDGRVRSQERDIAKYWRKSKINVALFGLENQTVANKLMPLRVFGYDGAEYVKQSRKENSDKAKYPVITLVLYLGYEKRWNYPKTLFEVLDIDEDIKPYVNDFKINLFEIAYLDREKIDLFKSDFRILADYLYQMRVNRDYIADETTIEHVEELLTLMSAMTGDNRFEETINDLKGKENINMCEVLDRVEARGIEKGRMEGRQEGIINILISLVNDGVLSVYEAALRADMSVEDFKKYINKNE